MAMPEDAELPSSHEYTESRYTWDHFLLKILKAGWVIMSHRANKKTTSRQVGEAGTQSHTNPTPGVHLTAGRELGTQSFSLRNEGF